MWRTSAFAIAWLMLSMGCRPVSHPPPPVAGAGGAPVCVDTQLCIRGDHWDSVRCMCVPDETAGVGASGVGGASGAPACIENQLCVRGSHWDTVECKCVMDADNSCHDVSDCHGPLPQLCEVCSTTNGTVTGGTACAHWACKQGQCAIAICD